MMLASLGVAALLAAGGVAGAPAEPPLYETRWVAGSVVDGSSVLRLPAEPEVYLSLTADGQLTGYDGCNWFGGEVTVRGRTIEIGSVTTTLRLCVGEGVHDTEVMSVLRDRVTYRIRGGHLRLTNDEGSTLVLHPDTTPQPEDDVSLGTLP